ncbi:MAG: 50S ribosomal protein L11 methyltransferase [Gammaproteobacteria bacterium]|nr:50S ribosomal protein L11 methyltransferase [Gammaproteobacteria bacterium]
MAWLQLVFEAPSDLAELLSDSLEGLGADAVTMRDAGDEPIFEQELGQAKLWSSTIISGLFEDAADTQVLISKLEDKIAPQPLPPCDIQFIPDEDWERAWLKDFKPTRFGRRLWVVPSVFDPPDTGAVNVILDPGLAFGTGTHPTTSMCLEWLDGHLKGGESVLDFGCGSGILAIAALKLGRITPRLSILIHRQLQPPKKMPIKIMY